MSPSSVYSVMVEVWARPAWKDHCLEWWLQNGWLQSGGGWRARRKGGYFPTWLLRPMILRALGSQLADRFQMQGWPHSRSSASIGYHCELDFKVPFYFDGSCIFQISASYWIFWIAFFLKNIIFKVLSLQDSRSRGALDQGWGQTSRGQSSPREKISMPYHRSGQTLMGMCGCET